MLTDGEWKGQQSLCRLSLACLYSFPSFRETASPFLEWGLMTYCRTKRIREFHYGQWWNSVYVHRSPGQVRAAYAALWLALWKRVLVSATWPRGEGRWDHTEQSQRQTLRPSLWGLSSETQQPQCWTSRRSSSCTFLSGIAVFAHLNMSCWDYSVLAVIITSSVTVGLEGAGQCCGQRKGGRGERVGSVCHTC